MEQGCCSANTTRRASGPLLLHSGIAAAAGSRGKTGAAFPRSAWERKFANALRRGFDAERQVKRVPTQSMRQSLKRRAWEPGQVFQFSIFISFLFFSFSPRSAAAQVQLPELTRPSRFASRPRRAISGKPARTRFGCCAAIA